MNANEHPKKDFWTASGMACAIIFKAEGLRKSIDFLLSLLKQATSIQRINIGCSSLSEKKFFLNMIDTDKNSMELARIPTADSFTIIAEDMIEKPVIINDLKTYRMNAEKLDQDVKELPFYNYNSLLRLPLFNKGSLIFWINFFSDRENCFEVNDIENYKQLIRYLMLGLKHYLYRESIPAGQPVVATNCFQRLSICPSLEDVCQKIKKVAKSTTTVLIHGESGVGKELVAEAIHELSPRADGPLVKVNCAAIAPSLLESELFGAEKGAYTGCTTRRQGYFEYANGGTIFLDEIGELQLNQQARLLRVLDNHVLQRVGSPQPVTVDVRVVAATNRNLLEMINAGTFRKDLYYRLSIYPIHVQPLRQRRADILPLAKSLVHSSAMSMGLKTPVDIDTNNAGILMSHDWPGNVRELANIVEMALVNMENENSKLEFVIDSSRLDKGSDENAEWPDLEKLEKDYILKVLAKTGGKLSGPQGAARILGIHYTTLNAKLKKYKIK